MRARRPIAALGVATALLFSPPISLGQAPPTNESPNRGAIALSGDLEIAQLVELVSSRLGASIQYRPEELRQRVTLRLRDRVEDDELWEILSATLESVGLAIVESEAQDVIRVVPLQQAATQHQRLRMPGDEARLGALSPNFSAIVVELVGVDPAAAAAAIAPILTPQTGQAKPLQGSSLLLIADVRRRVEQALAVIEMIDRPRDPVATFTVPVTSAPASEVAQSVQQVLAARLAVSGATAGRIADIPQPVQVLPLPDGSRLMVIASASREAELRELVAELDVRPEVETRAYAAPGATAEELAASIRATLALDATDPRVRIDINQLTGTAIVTAPRGAHERIDTLLTALRDSPPSQRRALRTYRVKNRDAEELRATLDSLLSGDVDTEWLDGAVGGLAPANANSDPARTRATRSGNRSDNHLTMTVDIATNTIIAVGAERELNQLEDLVAQLDRRQPQVMIEVTLVALTEGQARDLGVELSGQFSVGSTDVNLSSLFGLSAGSGPSDGGTGFTGSIVNPGDWEALIRAVETVTDGRTQSAPKVLVNNHATATLRAVAREPFTSLNASDTVATTSFGGTQDAGTTVTVTPHIAEGDHLVLEYAVELSAFTGESTTTEGGGIVPPPSQQNAIDGEVTIPDGFTVALGGIESDTKADAQTHVPLIGRLPLIGLLFRSHSDSDRTSKFYVFIHATVLRDPGFADLRLLSAEDMASARIEDGAPQLAPVWVD